MPAAARRLDLNAALAFGKKHAALAAFWGVMTMTVKEFIVKVVKQNDDPNSAAFLGTQISKQDRCRTRKFFAWLKGSAADNQQRFFSYTNCPSEGQQREDWLNLASNVVGRLASSSHDHLIKAKMHLQGKTPTTKNSSGTP